MTVVVVVVVKCFLGNLLQIISQNVKLIGDAEGELEDLSEQVKRLTAFIEDAAKNRSDSNLWDPFVKEIRITVYETEDTIDDFLVRAELYTQKTLVRAELYRPKTLITGCCAKLASFDRAVVDLKRNISAVRTKLKQHCEAYQHAFQLSPVPLHHGETSIDEEIEVGLSEDDEVIGFDMEATQIIERLVEGSELEVVPIVGMPGVGKTALAGKIYRDPIIAYEFYSCIWVQVGDKYAKEILLNILKAFTRRTEDYQDKDVYELSKKIQESISRGGRCLIVLDNVWTADAVDAVMNAFPRNNKGHRIMLTTRVERVARYANENPYYLNSLQSEQGFKLLKRKVFREGSFPEELVELGRSIVEKCNGVPLAIVVIAGTLRGCRSKYKWRRAEGNAEKLLTVKDDPRSCFKIVEMSYSRLPEDMKACFLYCATFPQGFDIPAWKLMRLWISEGIIISNRSGINPEDRAERILNDLVSRNLLIVTQRKADGEIKTCCLHDTLHEFCKLEAANQGLFQEVTQADLHHPGDSRRLCIQHSLLNDFLKQRRLIENVRSFLCFSSRKQIAIPSNDISYVKRAFPLIRVLDIEPLEFTFSRDFMKLFHLKYIAISGGFMSLPTFFGKFWNLQTVIVTSTLGGILDIKADIWNMLQLRHLHTNIPARLPTPSTRKDAKPSSLQTLSKVAPESCKKDVLARARNLRKLSIQGRLEGFFETQFSNFVELMRLENLKLLNNSMDNKALHLPVLFFGYLRKLRNLTLSNTRFEWSEASKLAQLECLEVLKLKHNAFTCPSWEMEIGGFSLLKVLWIENADLKTWKVSDLQFQSLRLLVLRSCCNLEAVPIEFASVNSLQEIRLENTNKAIESAQEIEQRKKEMQQECKSETGIKGKKQENQTPEIIRFKLTISKKQEPTEIDRNHIQ